MRKLLPLLLFLPPLPAFAQGTSTSGQQLMSCIQSGTWTVGGTGTFTVGGTITANQGGSWSDACTQSGTWTVQPGNTANTTPWLTTISQGGNAATVSATNALKVDGSAVTQPVSITGANFPDNEPFNVAQFGGTNVSTGTGAGGAGIPRVTISNDSSLAANQSTNVNQLAGTATAVNNGTASAGTLRVTVASDSTGNIATIGTSVTPGTAAANLGKAEDAVAGSADTGVAMLAVRNEGTTQLTSATGDYGSPTIDAYGVLYTHNDHPNRWFVNTLSTATTLTEIKAAPGAGLSLYITDISVYNSVLSTATADAHPTLKFGTGTNCGTGTTTFWRMMNGVAFDGIEQSFLTPIKLTANNALCFITSVAGTRVWNISGFTAP